MSPRSFVGAKKRNQPIGRQKVKVKERNSKGFLEVKSSGLKLGQGKRVSQAKE